MSFDRLNKMLAFGLVSSLIKKGQDHNTDDGKHSLADLNFKELEELYASTLEEVESSPDIREELVDSLKKYQKEHGDLGELYSACDIAADPTLQQIIFDS